MNEWDVTSAAFQNLPAEVRMAYCHLNITEDHKFTLEVVNMLSELKDNPFIKNVIKQRWASPKQEEVIRTMYRHYMDEYTGFDASEVCYDMYAAQEGV